MAIGRRYFDLVKSSAIESEVNESQMFDYRTRIKRHGACAPKQENLQLKSFAIIIEVWLVLFVNSFIYSYNFCSWLASPHFRSSIGTLLPASVPLSTLRRWALRQLLVESERREGHEGVLVRCLRSFQMHSFEMLMLSKRNIIADWPRWSAALKMYRIIMSNAKTTEHLIRLMHSLIRILASIHILNAISGWSFAEATENNADLKYLSSVSLLSEENKRPHERAVPLIKRKFDACTRKRGRFTAKRRKLDRWKRWGVGGGKPRSRDATIDMWNNWYYVCCVKCLNRISELSDSIKRRRTSLIHIISSRATILAPLQFEVTGRATEGFCFGLVLFSLARSSLAGNPDGCNTDPIFTCTRTFAHFLVLSSGDADILISLSWQIWSIANTQAFEKALWLDSRSIIVIFRSRASSLKRKV